jgi:hypothetical protein
VAGHEGSTVIVGLNGMRLLAQRAWTTIPAPTALDAVKTRERNRR